MNNNLRTSGLVALLRSSRLKRGLSIPKLAELVDIDPSSMRRIESGFIKQPTAEVLRRLAKALELDASDLLARAKHLDSTDLPQFAPYMRTKYKGLTPEDVTAIAEFAASIANRRGVSLTGPKPGEDE
jgi:transcriptional regulator with XRE-family HTH domain